jgi:putative protease
MGFSIFDCLPKIENRKFFSVVKKLELLSPAKNLECGIAAIRHGADAVYIGAPKFGAREAAGNSIGEISRLAAEARIFGAKTYVAFNTVLYDNELEEAATMIHQVYEAGADALIIQDFGILEMDLPPIPLHASTQANNFTPEKVSFLEKVGFKRAVLARELSLGQIREIGSRTSIELEVFVHGSLCVSLSGQCFMSHVNGGRSANRGACAQPCRKKYTLSDASGKTILEDKYLLSLRDLNRSDSIRELAESGVRSFKIEGRMKNIDYVKNVTAFYRKKLDTFLEERTDYVSASLGKTTFFFTPDPVRTFHRKSTDYFLQGRKAPVASLDSPKSLGEEIGTVTATSRDSFTVSGAKEISNNDGLTFIGRNGESTGLKVNRAESRTIFPDRMNGVFPGARIYRNFDHAFQLALNKKSAERKIPVTLRLEETGAGFLLAGPGDSISELYVPKVLADNPLKSRGNILRQLSRSGDTPFLVTGVETGGNEKYFFTQQQLNELRRSLLEKMAGPVRSYQDTPTGEAFKMYRSDTTPFPAEFLDFENNITNRLAMQFYRRHGVEKPVMGVEKRNLNGKIRVMITRHCIKHELGMCQRFGGTPPTGLTEPYFLQDGENCFELEFDCRNCLMMVHKELPDPK